MRKHHSSLARAGGFNSAAESRWSPPANQNNSKNFLQHNLVLVDSPSRCPKKQLVSAVAGR